MAHPPADTTSALVRELVDLMQSPVIRQIQAALQNPAIRQIQERLVDPRGVSEIVQERINLPPNSVRRLILSRLTPKYPNGKTPFYEASEVRAVIDELIDSAPLRPTSAPPPPPRKNRGEA